MKKLATILMLMAVVVCGVMTMEGKTSKKSRSSKSRSSYVAQAKCEGSDYKFNFKSNGEYFWDGVDAGKYFIKNGAYIMTSGHDGFYTIYDNTLYYCHDDDIDFWLASNGFMCPTDKLRNIFSFDPSQKAVRYSVDGISGTIRLDTCNYDPLVWIKK